MTNETFRRDVNLSTVNLDEMGQQAAQRDKVADGICCKFRVSKAYLRKNSKNGQYAFSLTCEPVCNDSTTVPLQASLWLDLPWGDDPEFRLATKDQETAIDKWHSLFVITKGFDRYPHRGETPNTWVTTDGTVFTDYEQVKQYKKELRTKVLAAIQEMYIAALDADNSSEALIGAEFYGTTKHNGKYVNIGWPRSQPADGVVYRTGDSIEDFVRV